MLLREMFSPQMSADCYFCMLWGFSQELEQLDYLTCRNYEGLAQRVWGGGGVTTPLSALKEGTLFHKNAELIKSSTCLSPGMRTGQVHD